MTKSEHNTRDLLTSEVCIRFIQENVGNFGVKVFVKFKSIKHEE